MPVSVVKRAKAALKQRMRGHVVGTPKTSKAGRTAERIRDPPDALACLSVACACTVDAPPCPMRAKHRGQARVSEKNHVLVCGRIKHNDDTLRKQWRRWNKMKGASQRWPCTKKQRQQWQGSNMAKMSPSETIQRWHRTKTTPVTAFSRYEP